MIKAGAPSAGRATDWWAPLSYLAGALVVTGGLWADAQEHVVDRWFGDRAWAEWNLAFAARVVTHLENPFFTTRLNAPVGVNTMANTTMLGLGLPVSPITLMFGPAVAFNLLIVIGLAATAAGWYYVLSRHLVTSSLAAWIGGLVCGFAPSVVAHASWHPNLVAQFLVPFIVLAVIRLREPGRSVRNGLSLGGLVVYQVFINEEMLFLTALSCFVFFAVYAAIRRSELRAWAKPFLSGLAVATGLAGVVLAYPLWLQFFGPGSYRGISHTTTFSLDLLSYPAFAANSVARRLIAGGAGPPMESEDNAFFGWPLLLAVIALTVWLWRIPVVRAAAITAVVFMLLSLGPEIIVAGKLTGIPGPWSVLNHLPLFDSALPVRLGQVTTPLIGVILAIGCDHLLTQSAAHHSRILLAGALAAVLVPAAPLPVRTTDRDAVPAFISQGMWRQYVQSGESILVVPLPTFEFPSPHWWSARHGLEMTLSHGYFLGPGEGGKSRLGPEPRATDQLLMSTILAGTTPVITDADRTRARSDFAYWRTAIVVLEPGPYVPEVTLEALNALAGQGQLIGGVWVWDVRGLR